jgi:hypothetical protein
MSRGYSKQDCVDSVRNAASKMGKSPSYKEYKNFARGRDGFVCAWTVNHKFGWDDVKEEAGLVSHSNNDTTFVKPDEVNMSSKEWKSRAPSEQKRLRNKAYIARQKVEAGCNKCGYDDSSQSLDAHHINPDDKEFSLSCMDRASITEIDKELSKCEILCSNCHRQNTFSYIDC